MREIRQSGSEGGEPHPNAASLPLFEEVAIRRKIASPRKMTLKIEGIFATSRLRSFILLPGSFRIWTSCPQSRGSKDGGHVAPTGGTPLQKHRKKFVAPANVRSSHCCRRNSAADRSLFCHRDPRRTHSIAPFGFGRLANLPGASRASNCAAGRLSGRSLGAFPKRFASFHAHPRRLDLAEPSAGEAASAGNHPYLRPTHRCTGGHLDRSPPIGLRHVAATRWIVHRADRGTLVGYAS